MKTTDIGDQNGLFRLQYNLFLKWNPNGQKKRKCISTLPLCKDNT